MCTFATLLKQGHESMRLSKGMTYGQVLHDQLPRNPPGRERSKGTWL